MSEPAPIFGTHRLGAISLRNRAVMAPMTRSRAIGNVPNHLMVDYYGARASAGLIVTEGTSPSPNGLGYPRIPGLFTEAQATAWKGVTGAVHDEGGRIFVQLMHTGRVSHPANLPAGARVLAPSEVGLEDTKMWVDGEGEQTMPAPEAMTDEDVRHAVGEFADSARLAVEVAGFDGVELHGANGYLLQQFLHPTTNQRTDRWGGSWRARLRFPVAVAEATADAIGPDRVGIRISPYGVFNEMPHHAEIAETYEAFVDELNAIGLAYLHLVDHSTMGAPDVDAAFKRGLRERFDRSFILSGGYDLERANTDLAADDGDLVAFARAFLANPDLVDRFREGAELNDPRPELFYSPGPEGYTDYPTLAEGVETGSTAR